MQAAVASALLSLVCILKERGGRLLWGCLLAGTIATYSSGNGILLWPILLAAAWWLQRRWQSLLAVAGAAAATVGLYFLGYRSPGGGGLLRLVHPLWSATWWCRR